MTWTPILCQVEAIRDPAENELLLCPSTGSAREELVRDQTWYESSIARLAGWDAGGVDTDTPAPRNRGPTVPCWP
jgi:hypothetical protein